jgi:IclR family mhp operon transcriptional activator
MTGASIVNTLNDRARKCVKTSQKGRQMDAKQSCDSADDKDIIRSLIRSIHVIQAINVHGSLGITEIAKCAGIPFPTAYRIVNTLLREGLIEREPSRKHYRPTALIQTLASGFQNHDRLVSIARPAMMAFTDQHHWPLTLVTRVGNKMVVRYSTNDRTTLTFNNYYPGWQVPLLSSASGQVYLAFAQDRIRGNLLGQFQSVSGHDAFTLQDFQDGAAIRKIQENGFAAVSKTYYSANPGKTSSLAVPLFQGDELVGSLAMVFFTSAMPLSKAIADFFGPLGDVAAQINQSLQDQPDPDDMAAI